MQVFIKIIAHQFVNLICDVHIVKMLGILYILNMNVFGKKRKNYRLIHHKINYDFERLKKYDTFHTKKFIYHKTKFLVKILDKAIKDADNLEFPTYFSIIKNKIYEYFREYENVKQKIASDINIVDFASIMEEFLQINMENDIYRHSKYNNCTKFHVLFFTFFKKHVPRECLVNLVFYTIQVFYIGITRDLYYDKYDMVEFKNIDVIDFTYDNLLKQEATDEKIYYNIVWLSGFFYEINYLFTTNCEGWIIILNDFSRYIKRIFKVIEKITLDIRNREFNFVLFNELTFLEERKIEKLEISINKYTKSIKELNLRVLKYERNKKIRRIKKNDLAKIMNEIDATIKELITFLLWNKIHCYEKEIRSFKNIRI